MKVKDLVETLMHNFPISQKNDTMFIAVQQENDKHFNFYEFINFKLNQFKKSVSELDKENIEDILKEFGDFKGNISKKRFINLINFIIKYNIKILQYCYKGDVFKASMLLRKFLNDDNKLKRYLIEPYINYFDFKIAEQDKLYRMRDEKEGEKVDNCSHVPFHMRHLASCGRFSLQGYPCLYLADSIETADAEVGELEKGKTRWFSEFIPKQILPLIDLRIPNALAMSKADARQQINFLLTYPIRLLCLVQTEEDAFKEEYFFAQLLFHLLFMVDKRSRLNDYKGIVFSSTKYEGGINYVIPALYNGMIPPSEEDSSLIKKQFHESASQIYKQ